MGFATDYSPILKECYQEKDVWNNLFRGSPLLAMIEKFRAAGKYYVVPMLYSRGGNVTGDYSIVASATSYRGKNAAMQVPYGNSFTWFTISPKEWNASDMESGAFIQLAKEMLFAAGEALRQTNGAAIYGSGLGDIGIVTAVEPVARLTFVVRQSTAMGMDIGSSLVFAAGPNPTGALRSASAVVVSSLVDDGAGNITVTVATLYDAAVAVGDWVCLYGFRESTATPRNYYGLRQILPTLGNRTGSSWTTYIGTSFCGVDRSAYPTRLAGEFVLRDLAGSELYSDAIVRGIRAVRRNGGKPDAIILNDFDFAKIIAELQAYKQYFQKINGPEASGKVDLSLGITSMAFAFSSNWVQYVADDPYCPEGIAYILEKDSWGMAMLSNQKPINENLPKTNEAGAPEISKSVTPPEAYAFNVDDYLAVQPSDTVDGQGARVTLQCFAALFCRQPGHNCVVKLDVTATP
jgi:hypothetical protein